MCNNMKPNYLSSGTRPSDPPSTHADPMTAGEARTNVPARSPRTPFLFYPSLQFSHIRN
ncbi:hypothetical protein FIBSPDRAFT_848322 [Athelia psychrophila]|uniref:Uncharacterized protein n=1 Tax=Athelia psychrophila TaxID=1759441 RepID=A0A166V9V3_9AGAM|nr:hypothetical protein FIBSPDRAFT_848322 [Fibularhizoctonia sp. CBS 109695]